jgi:hypothetical protein
MAQEQSKILPLFLDTDSSNETMKPDSSPFIKDLGWDINSNPQLSTGTGNPTGEGQNELALTPLRRNVQVPDSVLPDGYNKNVGTFESTLTKELYYLNYNSNSQHGIYIISGDNLNVTKVIIDPQLNFTDEQDGFFAEHRCTLRVKYDENKNIVEKYFIATNGDRWQIWINVIAAINTDGYNATEYPYYALQPPLFDRRELLEYPVRPPMQPVTAVSQLNNTNGLNDILDYGFEFCYQFIYTDGRETTVSPFSVPNIIQSQSFLANPDLIDNQWLLTLYAGSPLVEKINLFYRFTKKQQNVNAYVTWSDWYLYDTIYKFGTNIPVEYWNRTGAWKNANTNSYDSVTNTLTYIFDNTKLGQIVDQSLFAMVQTEMPILSVGLSDLGDGIVLGNNQYGYDNIPKAITDQISITVQEKTAVGCQVPTRKIRLYATVTNADNNATQVGFYNSKDTLGMRFGGITSDGSIDLAQSTIFNLYFGSTGENNAFVCYFKGTPYFSVGNWYWVSSTGVFTEVTVPLDYSDTGLKTYLTNVYAAGGYFVCVFDFEAPAGNYIATLGRHNVSLNQDFRGQSTYTLGLCKAQATLVQSSVTDYSKEFEVNCIGGDIDVWGDSTNSFLVLAPSTKSGEWCFNEGYIYDTRTTNNPFELLKAEGSKDINYGCTYTDKNGFFFMLRYATGAAMDVHITGYFECGNSILFQILAMGASSGGYNVMGINYVSDYIPVPPDTTPYNVNVNAILYQIKVTDSTGTIPYSNVSVTIKDGATANTNENGLATIVVHNASNSSTRESSDGAYTSTNQVYVNAASNFLITLPNCAYIPTQTFPTSACSTTQRVLQYSPYPLEVNAIANQYTSVKQQGSYSIGVVLADLAGRVTAIQKVQDITVPSFVSRGNTLPTYLQWAIATGGLKLNTYTQTENAAYMAFFVTKATNYKKYIQWVGDSITYYNAAGIVVIDPALATYCSVSITSLLNTNIQNNLNLLANYQFQQNDRLRIYDNGQGQLLSAVIDVPIQGTNYNQAAINAQLISPPSNTVLPSSTTTSTGVNLFVEYDNRFNQLQFKTGFWIEIYSPSENNDLTPFFQSETESQEDSQTFITSWMPIIDGEPSIVYNGVTYVPITGDLNYWDTYLFPRSITIPNAGVQFFTHNFESPNITDTWGYDAASGGQSNLINPYAKQMFYLDDTIKSDDYISQGLKNGLATFRNENRKVFKGYGRGGIVAIKTQFQLVFFLCENDWFVTDFNFNYIYANAQGVQIANLDNAMGTPHQKIGDNYGCAYEYTSSVLFNDKYAFWHDQRNGCYVLCDFRQAKDITHIIDNGSIIGIKSYYTAKSQFIGSWNENNSTGYKFDVVSGIDLERENIYLTFRPRRGKTNDLTSYVNDRRNIQLDFQETLVFNLNTGRWTRFAGFAPESYGKLRGIGTINQFFSFAAGLPYYHNNTPPTDYCTYYGLTQLPALMLVINMMPETIKILQNVALDITNAKMFIDLIYFTAKYSFSYVPSSYFQDKEGLSYGQVLRNGNTYPPADAEQDFRSMIVDGNRVAGKYFILRLIEDFYSAGSYFELNKIYLQYIASGNSIVEK